MQPRWLDLAEHTYYFGAAQPLAHLIAVPRWLAYKVEENRVTPQLAFAPRATFECSAVHSKLYR